MKTITKRALANQSKFAHDEALMFKAKARRNKLLGLWVADHLGKTGEEAVKYSLDMVRVSVSNPSEIQLAAKIMGEFKVANGSRTPSASDVKAKMSEFLLQE